jgi:hypothetical protein
MLHIDKNHWTGCSETSHVEECFRKNLNRVSFSHTASTAVIACVRPTLYVIHLVPLFIRQYAHAHTGPVGGSGNSAEKFHLH